VSIGELSWVGIGSSIKEGLSVGANVVVGAGSVVLQNVKSNLVVFGIPAKSR
jgi:acetyltransferase-like isoleucine patch superfamily enzyme